MATDHPTDNSQARLTGLQRRLLLDAPYVTLFGEVVRMASVACDKPISLISLVGERQPWFKARTGLDQVNRIPREEAFCVHATLANGITEINDAAADPDFMHHRLVRDSPYLRFYAGVPINLPQDGPIGTLSVIDSKPGQLSREQLLIMSGLANILAEVLDDRGFRFS